MKKKRPHSFLKRLVPQILVQSIAVVLSAIISSMFMTWLVVDVIKIEKTYLGAALESMGTLVLMILVLVSTNTYIYRKRLQEIKTLSDAISQVSRGDFSYRIQIRPHEPMAELYEDFNKMTAELSSVQILRNDFINSYSHEFKTPIASIGGFAELLLEKNLSEADQRQYLEIIRDEADRLATLARNTILLSKLSSQQIVTDTEQFNLGEQLRQCAIICSRSWLDKHQEFSSELPDVMYTGNRELMQHMWLNLLGNAIKYTPEGGEISVFLRESAGAIDVTIADTGEGMSEETMQHLFTPYYQGDSSRATQGLGLGLAIAKRIAELCGGDIHVESQPGAGSRFTVHLPLEQPAGQTSPPLSKFTGILSGAELFLASRKPFGNQK